MLAQLGSFFIGGDTNSSLPCDHDGEDREAAKERYLQALSHVLISLEEMKEENEGSQVMFFLSGGVPLRSIEATSLLLNHVRQLITRDESINRSDFSIAVERVINGLRQMKKSAQPVPRKLERLFGQERNPTLFEVLDALLSQSEEKDGIDRNDNKVEELKLHRALGGPPKSPRSECETFTEYGSGVSGTECLSLTPTNSTEQDSPVYKIVARGNKVAPDTVVSSGDTFPVYFTKVRLSEQSKVSETMFDVYLDKGTGKPVFEMNAGKVSPKNPSHYGEALQTIEAIRQSLDPKVENTLGAPIHKGDPKNAEGKQEVERHVILLPSMTPNNKTIVYKALKDDSDTVASDCDTTVDCSIESVTDENASQESEATEDSYWFNCAFDSMLDAVLGQCQASVDCGSSLSSCESVSCGSFHSYNEETDQDISVDGRKVPPTMVVF